MSSNHGKQQSSSSAFSGMSNLSRGDVSFIRATSNSGFPSSTAPPMQSQSILNEAFGPNSQHFIGHNPTHPSSHSMQEISSSHHHHHHQQSPHHHQQSHHRSHHQQQQQQHYQGQPLQYSPDHMTDQQPRPPFPGDQSIMPTHSHTGVETWTEKEESLAAELDEAKIRVAQMEKTMRWWSDCTSNWREKWNKARNERNKAREENRVLRIKLESMAKEMSKLKRQKENISSDKERRKEEEEGEESALNSGIGGGSNANSQDKLAELSEKEMAVLARANEKETESMDELSETSSPKSRQPVPGEKDFEELEGTMLSGQSSKVDDNLGSKSDAAADRQMAVQLQAELAETQAKAAQAGESLILMQRKLDEANNTIQIERLEICNKGKMIETLQTDFHELRRQLDEKSKAKMALEREPIEIDLPEVEIEEEMTASTEKHRDEINRLSLDLEDEASSRTTMDRHVTDLRRELERLQSENANEWGKRERLESEKLVLERDNKKLRLQVKDLEEELERRSQTSSTIADSDIKTLEFELGEKNKELLELKHLHSKVKKAYAERGTELEHHRRRAEQYEMEVRKLRARVDELKHDLCSAEDQVDSQSNAARKSQRTVDELQEQVDNLRVQVNLLQTRLRRSGNLNSAATPRSTSLKSLTLDDTTDCADSETDFDDV